jgi:NADPH-dependent 2,4-dienoyl-CoA reductase/sulfur reductase-like enzyme
VHQQLVVVGGSLAGLRAVEAARKTGYGGPITLVGAEEHLPYDRPPLSKEYLGSAEPGAPIFRTEGHLRDDLGVDLRLGTRAVGLDVAARTLETDGGPVGYTGLVIATGAAARPLPGAGSLAGVHTLRTVEDSRAVRAALDGGARTVIIGCGFIGSEVASAARARGLDVTVVEAAPVPLVRSVGAESGAVLANLHRAHGADLRLGTPVELVKGGDRVASVILADGTELPADLVVAGIGATPSTGWLAGSGVALHQRDGGVMCDDTLATSVPGVYAAGDVCHWRSDLFGQTIRVEHWTNAAEQGALAARNALASGEAKSYDTVPYFWSDWYDNRIQFVGLPGADEVEVIVDHPERTFLALYRKGDRLRAALTINLPAAVMKFRRQIANRTEWTDALDFARRFR